MTEEQIAYERGDLWIAKFPEAYTVYRNGLTHATADSSYPRGAAGFSLAKARVNYLATKQLPQP